MVLNCWIGTVYDWKSGDWKGVFNVFNHRWTAQFALQTEKKIIQVHLFQLEIYRSIVHNPDLLYLLQFLILTMNCSNLVQVRSQKFSLREDWIINGPWARKGTTQNTHPIDKVWSVELFIVWAESLINIHTQWRPSQKLTGRHRLPYPLATASH